MENYVELLCQQGYYSLSAFCKAYEKNKNNEQLTPVQERMLYYGYMFNLDSLKVLLSDYNEQPFTVEILIIYNNLAKNAIRRSYSCGVSAEWYHNKQLINGPNILKARAYFEYMAQANQGNMWGEHAIRYIALIDKRLNSK